MSLTNVDKLVDLFACLIAYLFAYSYLSTFILPNVSCRPPYICQCRMIDGLLPVWFPAALGPRTGWALLPEWLLWGAHVSSSQSPKSSSCRHGFWCRDGVREEYYWGYYHTRSFQRLHIFITGIAWSAAAHPALLFCLILIRDGNPCVVPLVPQHLGSAPHSILGLWLERPGLNERSQNKAAYVWKLGAVSTLRFEC